MKRVVFFVTHKTLTYNHADICFRSISKQNDVYEKFDEFIIYNTHPEELSNNTLIDLFDQYELDQFFHTIKIFEYDVNTPKALGADMHTILNYCYNNYSNSDRVLLLKSDCNLSSNYFNDLLNLPNDKFVYFVAPFICAKKRVSDVEICNYLSRTSYIQSDDITFFVEDTEHSSNNDFKGRVDGLTIDHPNIKFTSCYVVNDFSCHYLSVGLADKVSFAIKSWGGCSFENLISYLIKTDRSFVVHKYHDIISENRNSDREGLVKEWLDS